MLSTEETQLKLKDLRQALALEKQHRYVDMQGRRKTFSSFVCETLPLLAAWAPENELSALRRRFADYRFMDVGGRMSAIEDLSNFLDDLTRAGGNRRKSAASPPSSVTGPIHEIDVQYVRGVGPRLAQLLRQVGAPTVEKLLYYFPRRYLDYNNRVKIAELEAGQDVTVIGTIRSVSAHNARNGNMAIVSVIVEDETGRMNAGWFYGKSGRAALESYQSRFVKGADVMVSGKVKWDSYKRMPAMDRPQLEILSYQDAAGAQEADSLHAGRIVPVYSLVEGLNLRFLRKAIHQALQDYLEGIADPLPEEILTQYQLMDLREALRSIHFPESREASDRARERLVFDELFYVQLRLALMRAQYRRTAQGLSLSCKPGGYAEQFRAQLPFVLTAAQERVFTEIQTDVASAEPMYRLLQGDVGSGKTVVAVLTLLIAVENGYQGALMVPTEILAEQHYRKCVEWLTPLGLRVGLFVGKTGARERRALRQDLLNGQIHVAVGTHALIQDDVEFASLGMVVVDEQHRFGVRQRTMLKSKGNQPDMLTMTATPIPRSLAMTLHGDLDVSLLDERPPGRTPIRTLLTTRGRIHQAYQLIRQEILRGRQAYIVFPLIEESETLSAKAATTEAERLQAEVFQELRIGLLHGKMNPEEKDAVMSRFAAGQTDILVSTTVVEVGVDVPNATVMLIENADRFGLSQLHQLRGRVGRGTHQSYCVLASDSRSEETLTRLSILSESEDGFYIAEKDLELRGPGEFLGTRQSGLPDFLLADLIRDRATLEKAREAAFSLASRPDGPSVWPALFERLAVKTDALFSLVGSG